MEKNITLRVVTRDGLAFEESAVAIRAPGEVGYLGILRNHAPLVTTLKPGVLSWRRPDGPRQAARIGSGLLEVVRNRVTVLTDVVSEPKAMSERVGG